MRHAEFRELDRALAKLDDCDLGAWDRDFVDDMVKRVARAEADDTVWDFDLTPRQWEQVERMKGQYLD